MWSLCWAKVPMPPHKASWGPSCWYPCTWALVTEWIVSSLAWLGENQKGARLWKFKLGSRWGPMSEHPSVRGWRWTWMWAKKTHKSLTADSKDALMWIWHSQDFLAHIRNLLFHMKIVSSYGPDSVLLCEAKLEAQVVSPFDFSALWGLLGPWNLINWISRNPRRYWKSPSLGSFFLILSFFKCTIHWTFYMARVLTYPLSSGKRRRSPTVMQQAWEIKWL